MKKLTGLIKSNVEANRNKFKMEMELLEEE